MYGYRIKMKRFGSDPKKNRINLKKNIFYFEFSILTITFFEKKVKIFEGMFL